MSLKLITGDKRFYPLFWAQFLGALNDNFFKNSLVMLITYRSVQLGALDSKLLVPAAGAIFIFPFFIFSATAGQIADGHQKSTLVRIIKLVEVFIMLMAAAGLYFNSYGLLLFVLFLMGAQSAFFGPIKYGILPSLVDRDELVSANAFISSGTFVAILFGTIFGGWVVSLEESFFLNSLGLILFALLGYLISRKISDVKVFNSKERIDYTFFRPTWKILRLTMKDKNIFRIILGISWFWFLGAAILSLLPILCRDILGAGPRVGTLFLAIFVVGMACGSFLIEKISFGRAEVGIIPIAAVMMAVFLADMYWVSEHWGYTREGRDLLSLAQFFQIDSSWRIVFDLLMVSFFGGTYIVPQMTRIQEIGRPEELARTIAGNNIWNALFMVTSGIFIMVLSSMGIAKIFLILAVLSLIAGFILYSIYSEYTVRFWGWLISHTMYRLEFVGLENIPKEGPFIIASNHISFVDWLLIYAAVKRPVRFVIDHQFYFIPMGPFFFKQAKLVPIATKRESQEVLDKAFDDIHQYIQEGSVLGIFPEGWISRDGELRRFQPGINKILKRDPIPVILCGIDGLWGSIFSFEGGKVILKWPRDFRKKVRMTFSKPFLPEEYNSQQAEKLMRQMVGHYKNKDDRGGSVEKK